MSPLMLRRLWSVVETTQTQVLLSLDDTTLVQWLLKQLRSQQSLDHEEVDRFSTYIESRLPLIRDLAQNRMVTH